jgi:RNA polymerase sigma-70 factor (ECF subfamily)
MLTADDAIPGLTDAQLVGIVKQGDREAFGELIRRHRGCCLRRATSILRNHSEADEETQNAFWNAFEHVDQFRGEGEFLGWLLRIVENQCLILIRRKRQVQFVQMDPEAERWNNKSRVLPDSDPEGDYGYREVLQVLRTEIRRIPPFLRNMIVMCDIEELPVNEAATRLGISVAAAKARLLRARKELRRRMLKHSSTTGASNLMTRVAAPPARVFHQRVR